MSIKKKFIIVMSIFVVSIIIFFLMSYNQGSKFKTSLNQVYKVNVNKMEKLFDINQKVLNANIILNKLSSYAVAGMDENFIKKEGEKGLKDFNQAINEFIKIADNISKNTIKNKAVKYLSIYKKLISKAMIGDSYTCIETYPKSDKIINSIISLIKKQTINQSIATKKSYIDSVNYITKSKYIMLVISVIVLIIMLVVLITIGKSILENIDMVGKGLNNFFSFLNKKTNDVKLIPIKGSDEIAAMANVINENITNTKSLIEQDHALINDVKRVVALVKNGKIKQQITASTQNEGLEELKIMFNEMLDIMAKNVCEDINKIKIALDKFHKLDFTYKIEDDGEIAVELNNLVDIINQMLLLNKKNGLTLQNSSKILLENVNILSTNANQAAASLEQTAAALEEITSNISNTTNDIVKMSKFTDELTHSATEGKELANETTKAMEEIDNEVKAINEAISVIDQIAFQTNILSLNAAVEAATAGEAGKGFAVVAGEVRNLAARSAEAANEIKKLVENATLKADNGKEIAEKMIEGYNQLDSNIKKTIELISDIENASKEQLAGIEQINNTIASLDTQTQQNASIASKTEEIANETNNIAQVIVEDVDKKEFVGKDSVY